MSLKTERDLNTNCRNQVNRAKTAAQSKNYDYAITLLQAVLKEEPLFLEGRRYLRAVEIQKFKAQGTFTRQMASMRMSVSKYKGTPQEQLIQAEEALVSDPYQLKANTAIGEAGIALGFPEFKCFAFETLRDGKPTDKAILNQLATAYMEAKDPEKAEKTYEAILVIDPADGDALSGLKNASAARSHEKWGEAEKTGNYREALNNEKQAAQLETEGKVVKTADAIAEQIQVNYEKYQADPTNPTHPKQIAKLYETRNDFTSAHQWYKYAFDVGNGTDSSLEKVIGDLKLRASEQEIFNLKAQLAAEPDETAKAQLQEALTAKENELNIVRLELAEARVKAQPNEGEFRYELGNALFKVGEYKRATAELQESLKQPSVRYQALNLLGLSFMKRNMYDFAANRLSLAQTELPGMDEIKKEVTYNLGLVYEAMKKPPESLNEFKKIYEVDMSYRDVAERVEASYSNGEEAA